MKPQLTRLEALKLAVETAGTQVIFANALGVSQPTVCRWLNQSKQIPAEFVLRVERLYGVSKHDLRPDIYPASLAFGELDDLPEDTLANPLADRFCAIDLGTSQRMTAGGRR